MVKRKAEDDTAPRKKRVFRKTARKKAVDALLVRKKELKKDYKKVLSDLKIVDKDLKSLGKVIRKK